MKIIQVQTQAEAAGAQRISDMVGEGLRQQGHEVRTVFLYRKTDAYDADGHADFILDHRPRGIAGQLRAVLGLMGYLRRNRPDAVLSYQHFGNVVGTLGGRLAGARRLIVNQSGLPWRHGLRGLATAVDRIFGTLGLYHHSVVNSATTEAAFAAYPASYRGRIRRIDHGIVGPEQAYDRTAARAAFGLPEASRIVVSTGRLDLLKSHATLVEALHLLPPDVHVAIAGAGPERSALEERAEHLQLARRHHLVGELPPSRIFEFLAAGDVYAFPSREETFGLAVVEAACAGLPVVASDLAVLREVLKTGTGEPAAVFVPPGEPTAFAAALETLLSDSAAATRLAGLGRSLGQKYASAAMVSAYERLLA